MKQTIKETNDIKRYAEAFWTGWLSVYNPSIMRPDLPDFDRGPERDREALASDWQRVGNDLRWAMGQVSG
jgi:hypothetical protein